MATWRVHLKLHNIGCWFCLGALLVKRRCDTPVYKPRLLYVGKLRGYYRRLLKPIQERVHGPCKYTYPCRLGSCGLLVALTLVSGYYAKLLRHEPYVRRRERRHRKLADRWLLLVGRRVWFRYALRRPHVFITITAAYCRLGSGYSRYRGCYYLRWPVMTPFMNSHIGFWTGSSFAARFRFP